MQNNTTPVYSKSKEIHTYKSIEEDAQWTLGL